ncbi:DUF2780 domain-containing protein [Shewanella sp. NIFS-20-20]|uniref:DUF2780 domain-containing protein n=1 Tax=Shewanella sp. NIFS-20-20 TaxID=2853806 RepID=UPI001C43EB7B|nr:DUF2780 domain-containing protein [Shewanella sp. NIFS-20-20]MBV7316675.1 DUF2780 domain-containing protein [Shewanella sp. NIFS-20-20]
MRKSTAIGTLLIASLSMASAQASWFDDLFGSSKKTETPTQAPAAATANTFSDNALVNSLSSLNLNPSQTEGGIGSILQLAKSTLGDGEFASLSKSIPGVDSLLAAAPVLSGDNGLSGLLASAGDVGKGLQGSAMVYDAFEKLGIPKDMVIPMINGVKSYLESQGDTGAIGLLNKGLGALL